MPERSLTAAKSLDVVTLLAREGPLSLSEVSERLGLSKPVAHRALATLREANWVEQVPESRRYRLGLLIWELGTLALQHVPLYGIAVPMVERLAIEVGANCGVAVYDSGEMLFVARVQFLDGSPLGITGGIRVPAHTTSSGKVALAFQPEIAEAYLKGELPALTTRTVTDANSLRAELAEVRRRGFGLNRDGRAVGSSGIAAPVFDHRGEYVASVYCAASSERFSEDWVLQLAGRVKDCAANVSLALGFRGDWTDPSGLG